MDLGIKERFELFNLLPHSGGFGTALVIRSLREKLEFSEKEAEQIGLVIEEVPIKGRMGENTGEVFLNTKWNPEHAKDRFTVDLSRNEELYLKRLVGELASQDRLPETLWDLATKLFPERFVTPG